MPVDVMFRVFIVVLGIYVAAAIILRVVKSFRSGRWNRHRQSHSADADGTSGGGDHDGNGSDGGGSDGGGGGD